MKKIVILLVLLLLSGCASSKASNLNTELDKLLNNIPDTSKITNINSNKYYSYSLPSDVVEIDGNQNASVLTFNNSTFVMNLNIASIINNKYYEEQSLYDEGFFDNSKLLYNRSIKLNLENDNETNLVLDIYKDENYYIHLYTNEINMYGKTNEYEIIDLTSKMLQVAKTIDVNSKEVITNYSSKDVIDYKKKQIDLFDYVLPTDGYLQDLVNSVGGVVKEENVSQDLETQEATDENS